MRCDKCKYWEQKEEQYSDEIKIGLGECTKAKPFWEVTEWSNDGRVMMKEFEDLKMFVQDGSDYSAHLWTRPDFGCTHFEV